MSEQKSHYEKMVDTEMQHTAERITTEGEGSELNLVLDGLLREIASLRVDIKLMERRKKDV